MTALDTFSAQFYVQFNGQDVTTGHGVVYSVASESGCDASINATTGVYTVSSVALDSAFATFKAVYQGNEIYRGFNVAKARRGSTGSQGPQGPTGGTGATGATPPIATANREVIQLYAFSSGDVENYNNADLTVSVFVGSTDVTSSFAFAVSANPQNLTYTRTGNKIVVNGGFAPAQDVAVITFTATGTGTYTGYTFNRTLTLTKITTGPKNVSSLPSSGLFEGRQVFLTTDKRLYVYKNGGWKAQTDATEVVGQLEGTQIKTGAIDRSKFAADIEAATPVSSLPSTKSTNMVFNTTDGKLYTWNGTAYTKSVATSDLSGTIANSQIADLAATKITGTLTNAQLAAIDATKVTGQLTDAQIAALSTTKLSGTITDAQLTALSATKVTGQLTKDQIASVDATKVQGELATAQLANGAVSLAKLKTGVGSNMLTGATPGANPATFLVLYNPDNVTYDLQAAGGSPFLSPLFGSGWPGPQWTIGDSGTFGLHHANATGGSTGYSDVTFCTTNSTTGGLNSQYPAEAGKTYEFSIYTGAHRCTVTGYLVFQNANGDWLNAIGAGANASAKAGGTSLDSYMRLSARGTAPTGTTAVVCMVRKYHTNAGQVDSWMFAAHPMLGETSPNATELLPWNAPAVGIIRADQIMSRSITASQIAAGTLTANEIATGAITITSAGVLGGAGSGSVTLPGMGYTGDLNATRGAPSGTNVGNTASTTVESYALDPAARVNANTTTINGGKITTGTVDTGQLKAGAVTTATLAAGAVTTSTLAAGAVVASKLAITGESLWPDPQCQDLSWWSGPTQGTSSETGRLNPTNPSNVGTVGWTFITNVGALGSRVGGSKGYWQLWSGNSNDQFTSTALTQIVPPSLMAKPNTTYEFGVGCTNGSNKQIATWIQYLNNTGALITGGPILTFAAGDQSSIYKRAQFTTPANCASFRIYWETPAGGAFSGFITVGNMTLREAASGTMIVDGTVTGTKVAANTITAANIAADTITANEIGASAITATELAAGSVVTGKIAAGAVTANEIAAGSVVTSKLAVIPQSIIPDPYFADEALWTGQQFDANGWYFETNTSANNARALGVPKCLTLGTASNIRRHVWSRSVPFSGAGQVVRLRAKGINGAPENFYVAVRFLDHANVGLADMTLVFPAGSGVTIQSAQMAVPATAVAYQTIIYNEGGVTRTVYPGVGAIKLDVAASADLLVDGTITGNKLVADTITSTQIAADAITTNELAAGAVVAAKIAANAVSADKLAVGLRGARTQNITFQVINGNTLTWTGGILFWTDDNNNTVTQPIIAGSIAYNGHVYVSFQKQPYAAGGAGFNARAGDSSSFHNAYTDIPIAIYEGGYNVTVIAGATIIDGRTISTGTITAEQIGANQIVASKLNVSAFDNLAVNADLSTGSLDGWSRRFMANGSYIDWRDGGTSTSWPSRYGLYFYKAPNDGAELSIVNGVNSFDDTTMASGIAVEPDDEVYVEFVSHSSAGGNNFHLEMIVRDSPSNIHWMNAQAIENGQSNSTQFAPTPGTYFKTSSCYFRNNGLRGKAYLRILGNFGGGQEGYIWNLKMRRRNAGKLIVDGSITTDDLAAGSVTAGKIGVTELSAITGNIGLLRTATVGQRTEINNNGMTVFNGNGNVVARFGVW